MLYIFEDSETDLNDHQRQKSNHETRIQNLQSCSWLVVWQNQCGSADSNQIRRHQTHLADILKEGNITRDEWHNLLHLFNISHFSSLCCAKNFSTTSCPETMAKKMQEEKGEATAYVPHLEKVFSSCETEIRSQPRRQNGKSRCECGYMEDVYVRYSSSCSPSQERLCRDLRSIKNQPKRTLRQIFHATEKLIMIRKKLLASQWSIGSSLFGKGQPCLLTRQFSLWLQKLVSYPIQYCVWAESVQIPSKRRLIGLWNHVHSENWMESTENRWSSSGQFSQESRRCRSSLRFTKRWLMWSVNLNYSKEKLSSCQRHGMDRKREPRNCIVNSFTVPNEYARKFAQGHWSFLGPGSEKKWYGTHENKPNGELERCCWYYDA